MAWYSVRESSCAFDVLDCERLANDGRWWLPGIQCPSCGKLGYGKHIAWVDGNDAIPLAESFTWLAPDEWWSKRDGWAAALGVEPERLAPGVLIGRPVACRPQCTGIPLVNALMARWWARRDVFDDLAAAGVVAKDACVDIEGWPDYCELLIESYATDCAPRCVWCRRRTGKSSDAQVRAGLGDQNWGIIHRSTDSWHLLFNKRAVEVLRKHRVPPNTFMPYA
jgi:hypothetical protein